MGVRKDIVTHTNLGAQTGLLFYYGASNAEELQLRILPLGNMKHLMWHFGVIGRIDNKQSGRRIF